MRILVTSSAMAGHFGPLVPFLEALRDSDHDVLLLLPDAARARAEQIGVPIRVAGSPAPVDTADLWQRFRTAEPAIASVIANREIFGRLHTAAMLPDVERAFADHRPEFVLHEVTEYAGPIVASRHDVPHAQVAISLAGVERGSLEIAAPALAAYGSVVDTLNASPYLTRFPPLIDPSDYPDTRRYREPHHAPRPLPDWWDGSAEPLVYLTFGTVAAGIGTGVYRTAVEAVADLPVRALVTTGSAVELGPLPANVRVREWVDQRDALGAAAVVVCHGGSGTTMGALSAGVPIIIVAMFADQRRNADALSRLGVASVIESDAGSAAARAAHDPRIVDQLRAAVMRALTGHERRAAAERVAADLAELPTPQDLLAELVR